jgi:hypothetical protein
MSGARARIDPWLVLAAVLASAASFLVGFLAMVAVLSVFAG